MEITFTDLNFNDEVLKSQTPVLVDFWAPWCGPCRMMAPIVEELAGELEGQIKIGKLNVDEGSVTAQSYGIMSVPTFLVFKGGQVVEQIVGGMTKDALKEKIEKHI